MTVSGDRSSCECSQRKRGGGEALLVNSLFTIR